jgi:site-specific recombinase XerD
LLLNNGVDLKVVSEDLGHCDIGVTANIYADVLKSTKAKVAKLVTLKLECETGSKGQISTK